MTTSHHLQDVVHALNFIAYNSPVCGSPAMRLLGRPVMSIFASAANTLSEEQIKLLTTHLEQARAKAVKRRCRAARQMDFLPNDRVRAWDHRGSLTPYQPL